MVKGLVLEAKRTPFEKQDVKCQMLSVDFWGNDRCQMSSAITITPQQHFNFICL